MEDAKFDFLNIDTYTVVSGKKRNTLSNCYIVDHVGLAYIFYLHLLKTFRFIPDTL